MCTFQEATLTLQVKDANNVMLPTNMETYSGQSLAISFRYDDSSGLLADTNYTALATVVTITGNVSAEANFGMWLLLSLVEPLHFSVIV